MRKNGVNRQLEPIEGGVCAPSGFCAAGFHGLSLIVGEKRFPAAGVFSQSAVVGAPVLVSKKHLSSGYARVVFVNSGQANVCQENGESAAREICREVAKRLRCDVDEILIASTGKIAPRFDAQKIIQNIEPLTQKLGVSHEHSIAAARNIMTSDKSLKQLSFAFDVGDYRCKIGAIFKGNARVCPNMATTLCFLTTDVNITPQMLQKALSSAVGETLNMLDVDGLASPNDSVCILSSRTAGNYQISCADSEYKKFASALQKTLAEICFAIIKDGDKNKKTFECEVRGAKSKREARVVAKSIVSARITGRIDWQTDDLICAILGAGEPLVLDKTDIVLSSQTNSLTLMTGGKPIAFSATSVADVLVGEEIALRVDLNAGNYGATAFSRL